MNDHVLDFVFAVPLSPKALKLKSLISLLLLLTPGASAATNLY